MITQRAKYALHALIALARAKGPLSTSKIAETEQIPSAFLEQILMQLKHHGILESKRGKFGGYELLLPADRITVVRRGRTMSFGRVTLSSAADNKPVAMVSSAFAML